MSTFYRIKERKEKHEWKASDDVKKRKTQENLIVIPNIMLDKRKFGILMG